MLAESGLQHSAAWLLAMRASTTVSLGDIISDKSFHDGSLRGLLETLKGLSAGRVSANLSYLALLPVTVNIIVGIESNSSLFRQLVATQYCHGSEQLYTRKTHS